MATMAWLAATLLFSLYLSRLDSLGRVYGSLGAIVLLQFWLLASSLIFLLGARFNVEFFAGTWAASSRRGEGPPSPASR